MVQKQMWCKPHQFTWFVDVGRPLAGLFLVGEVRMVIDEVTLFRAPVRNARELDQPDLSGRIDVAAALGQKMHGRQRQAHDQIVAVLIVERRLCRVVAGGVAKIEIGMPILAET